MDSVRLVPNFAGSRRLREIFILFLPRPCNISSPSRCVSNWSAFSSLRGLALAGLAGAFHNTDQDMVDKEDREADTATEKVAVDSFDGWDFLLGHCDSSDLDSLGHLVRECRDNLNGLGNVSEMKFGAWLKAPVSSRTRYNGGRRTGPNNTSNDGEKERMKVGKSTVSAEGDQLEVAVEMEGPVKIGSNNVFEGEAPSVAKSVAGEADNPDLCCGFRRCDM
ncbi:hypothetical protein ACOSQ4_005253 [Xanthoceras sorbifolium]